ncbi:MAG: ribosome maturation factor RimM [Ectothiorhodospiraceae bacterium]
MSHGDPLVILGRISGLFGVAGWVRVYSYTDPRENILKYPEWQLGLSDGWRQWRMTDGRRQGKAVVARLDGVDDRDQARALIGSEIAIPRSALPPAAEGEYYWADLQGLRVYNTDGRDFGVVTRLMETGANDVLVVEGERERLIPMVPGAYVVRVEPGSGFLEVDWDPDF